MKKQVITAIAAASMLLAFAPAAMAQNIAIVNGKAVAKSRVDALAQQMARSGRPIPPEMQAQLKDEVILREVMTTKTKSNWRAKAS
jgi:peptidyl-prolyl cis-trans isomerase C